MEKINVFLFRVLCVCFYFSNGTCVLNLSDSLVKLLPILGFILLFIFYFKKKQIKNKIVLLYEIIFCALYIKIFDEVLYILTKDFITNTLLLSFGYCLIIWLLLSYYDFNKKE